MRLRHRIDPLVAVVLVTAACSWLMVFAVVTMRDESQPIPTVDRHITTVRVDGRDVRCTIDAEMDEGQVVTITLIECEP